MAKSNRQKMLEGRLNEQQKKAAFLLVENELKDNKDPSKLSYEQVAEEIGVTYKTIWKWRTKNRDFIDYKNLISDDFLSDKRTIVYRQLMSLIEGPQPSVKAIDLYMKREGLLTEKKEISLSSEGGERTNEDLARELSELDELLESEE